MAWTAGQARALRAASRTGHTIGLDFDHLADEIESLGRADRRALASHIRLIIEHLLKLEASPATNRDADGRRASTPPAPRSRPCSTTVRASAPICPGSWSARPSLPAGSRPGRYGEQPRIEISERRYTVEEIAGDWLPGVAR